MRARRHVGVAALLATVVISLLLGPAVAAGATASGVIATSPAPVIAVSSTRAGAAADLLIGLDFSYSQASDSLKDLSVTLAPGMWVAPDAVAATCSSAELSTDACPARSQIGDGIADLAPSASQDTGTGPDQTATVALYLMPASGSDVAGIGAVFSDGTSGRTTTTAGTLTLLNGATSTPQLQLTLSDLPQSSSGTALTGTSPFQLSALELELNGNAPSADGSAGAGKQFVHLPTSCAPVTIGVAVDTDSAPADGAASGGFTPTGCPLAFTPRLAVSAIRDSDDQGTAFVSAVRFPAEDSALQGLTLKIPDALIGPSAQYADLNCASTPPFSGCPIIGAVQVTTPLSTTPLVGTIYLTGNIYDFGIGVSLPPPFALSFDGHLTLASPYVVSFTALPDFPLTSLLLSFPAGENAVFLAVCSTVKTGTVSGSASGFSGAHAPLTATLTVRGCPQKAAPKLSFVIRLSSRAKSRLKQVKLRLPKGLSFNASGLRRALKISGATDTFKLDHGVLVLNFSRTASAVTIHIATAGIAVSATAPRSPHLGVTVTDKDGKSTHLVFTLGLQG